MYQTVAIRSSGTGSLRAQPLLRSTTEPDRKDELADDIRRFGQNTANSAALCSAMMGMLQDPPVTALDFGQDACSLESEDVRRLMRDLTAHAQGAQPEVSIDWTFAWPATMKEYPSWLTCFGNWLDAIKPVVRLLPFELDESTRANPYFALREKKGEFWSTQTIEGETVAREYDRLKSGVTSVVAMNQHGTRAMVTAFADSVQDHLSQLPSPEAAPEHREVYLCDQGGHIVPIAFIRTNGKACFLWADSLGRSSSHPFVQRLEKSSGLDVHCVEEASQVTEIGCRAHALAMVRWLLKKSSDGAYAISSQALLSQSVATSEPTMEGTRRLKASLPDELFVHSQNPDHHPERNDKLREMTLQVSLRIRRLFYLRRIEAASTSETGIKWTIHMRRDFLRLLAQSQKLRASHPEICTTENRAWEGKALWMDSVLVPQGVAAWSPELLNAPIDGRERRTPLQWALGEGSFCTRKCVLAVALSMLSEIPDESLDTTLFLAIACADLKAIDLVLRERASRSSGDGAWQVSLLAGDASGASALAQSLQDATTERAAHLLKLVLPDDLHPTLAVKIFCAVLPKTRVIPQFSELLVRELTRLQKTVEDMDESLVAREVLLSQLRQALARLERQQAPPRQKR